MRQFIAIVEAATSVVSLPPAVAKAFHDLAVKQRGEPEMAMLAIQHTNGGGVLSVVVEHVGDLIHRVSDGAEHDYCGRAEVLEKTTRCLRYLEHPYGFAREAEQNIIANAPYRNLTPDQLREKVDRLMARYTAAHKALPAYNEVQYECRRAAVAVGERDWTRAIVSLRWLQAVADQDDFCQRAFDYRRAENGDLLLWRPGRW